MRIFIVWHIASLSLSKLSLHFSNVLWSCRGLCFSISHIGHLNKTWLVANKELIYRIFAERKIVVVFDELLNLFECLRDCLRSSDREIVLRRNREDTHAKWELHIDAWNTLYHFGVPAIRLVQFSQSSFARLVENSDTDSFDLETSHLL